jgi:signal peptidase I
MDNLIDKNISSQSIQSQQENHLNSLVTNHYNNQDTFTQRSFGKSVLALFFGGLAVWFMDSIQVIVIALGVFIIFHLFIISPHTIEGPSMEPNFCNGDLVLADKLTPRFNPYKVGDVIIFKKSVEDDYIKRIIGVGGDQIKVENGSVYRNGNRIEETYLPEDRQTKIYPGFTMIEGKTYTVPMGEYLVFGDNRDHSTDSRSFLYIDPNTNIIKGRVIVLIWPIKDFRVFDNTVSRPENSCSAT